MEQTTQQITQKLHIPIKTKIAAWWMIVLATMIFILNLIASIKSYLIYGSGLSEIWLMLLNIVIIPLFSIGILISSIFILKRNKIAWWGEIIFLTVSNFCIIGFFIFLALISSIGAANAPQTFIELIKFLLMVIIYACIYSFLVLMPLILFLFDRKNFFKIAS